MDREALNHSVVQNLRWRAHQHDLVARAAAVEKVRISEFIRDAAVMRAKHVLKQAGEPLTGSQP